MIALHRSTYALSTIFEGIDDNVLLDDICSINDIQWDCWLGYVADLVLVNDIWSDQ